ncbi:hypothetical protein IEE92_00430 [Kocuria sp. cx-116]|uniref:hypothetical protein n=1 Tax=Kocuria sp. cx-116 TaxID=2771378 RepID=UPI0016860D8A|nr:hypothetical protein [Kocuria sp. cx-116]MBD2761040.1 hypothetical protein [Kocuria sp. cx-116]
MVPASQQQSPDRPWPVWLICAVVGLEAVALAYVGARFVISLFSDHAVPTAGIVFGAVVMLGAAVWLGSAAWGTVKGLRWPRAAILVSQAFLVIVGISLTQVGARAVGVASVAGAVITLIALFSRPTVAWMGESTRYPSA